MHDDGYNNALKMAGLTKEAINPMQVMKHMAARRPTKQLARHFDNPGYIVPDSPFGAISDKARKALPQPVSERAQQAAKAGPSIGQTGQRATEVLQGTSESPYAAVQRRMQEMGQQAGTREPLQNVLRDVQLPTADELMEQSGFRQRLQSIMDRAMGMGGEEVADMSKRDAPLSPMLADKPMSTAMRKQYPKAPMMAAQMERTEEALARQLGERAKELPVYAREGIERTNYIPPATEKLIDVQKGYGPSDPGEAWEMLKGVAIAPQGSGQINLGIMDPAILAHEGRHATQFLPAEGSGYRPGMIMGKPAAIPRQNIAGKPSSELKTLLDVERDANRAVPGMIPDLSPEQRALQGAAQSTYESMLDPELRGMVFGRPRDVLPTGAQARDVLERLMGGESVQEALQQSGSLDELIRYGERMMGGGKWYDAPGTPAPLQQKFRRAAELRENVRGREAEELLSPTGVETRGRVPEEGTFEAGMQRGRKRLDPEQPDYYDAPDEDIPLTHEVPYEGHPLRTEGRLSPMSGEITPFDQRFWRSAAMDPESVTFQANRHRAVTDQLRTALGDEYADAYDDYVRKQVAASDPRSLFAEALNAPAPGEPSKKPSGFVDKIRGMFG